MKPKDEQIQFVMTRAQAQALGILKCACGHPENNHFNYGVRPCAHCNCNEFREKQSLPKVNNV